MERQINGRQIYKQTDRQTERQTDKWVDCWDDNKKRHHRININPVKLALRFGHRPLLVRQFSKCVSTCRENWLARFLTWGSYVDFYLVQSADWFMHRGLASFPIAQGMEQLLTSNWFSFLSHFHPVVVPRTHPFTFAYIFGKTNPDQLDCHWS